MGAPVGVRVADNRLGGLQPVRNRTARVPRFIPAVALVLLALTLTASLATAVPRPLTEPQHFRQNPRDVFWSPHIRGKDPPPRPSREQSLLGGGRGTRCRGDDRARRLCDPTRAPRGTLSHARQRHVDPPLV